MRKKRTDGVFSIDGDRNSLHEVDIVGVPTGPDNPHGNAFTWRRTPLRTEHEAMRMADSAHARVWEIRSVERTIASLPPEYAKELERPEESGDMRDWPRIAKLQSDLLVHAASADG